MTTITKFSFETNFDAVDQVLAPTAEEEAPPPAPTFSDADITAAREAGFQEGHQAGTAEVLQSTEHRAAEALSAISDKLASIGPAFTQTLQRSRQEAINIARAITKKMVAVPALDTILPSVEAVIGEILPRIMDEPRVVIRVSDGILDPLQEKLPSVTEKCGFPGSLILLGEPGLNGPDCKVEWADGGAEYHAENLWAEIDGVIDRYLVGVGVDDTSPGDDKADTAAAPIEPINTEEQPDG